MRQQFASGKSLIFLLLLFLSGCILNLSAQNCSTPTNPVVTGITPVTATLNWDAMLGANAYEVNYRPMNAPSTVPWNTVNAAANSITVTALAPSTLYTAQIRSVCGSNFSDFTSNVTFSTESCVPPSGITVANINLNSANVQWTPANGAVGYQLLYRVAVTNAGAWSSVSVPGNSHTLTGLNANTLYGVRLVSDCGGTTSDTSQTVFFSTGGCEVPQNLMITAQTASSVSLSWNPVQNVSVYNLQYRAMGINTWTSVNSNTNSRTINGLTGNTLYEFRVRTNCGGGNISAFTLPINGFTLPCAMPENAMVSNVTVNSAQISWNNAVGANQYRIDYRAIGQTWTTVNASAATRNLTGLTPDTDYEVRLRSRCGGNQFSAYTDTLVFRTLKCYQPSTPRLTDIDINSARIEWNSVRNATRYQLDYKTGNQPWTTVTTPDTFRTLNNLIQNQVYEVRLRSQCGGGIFSDYPDTLYVVPSECTSPTSFQLQDVRFTEANLVWDTTDYATQYRIEYKKFTDLNWLTRNVSSTDVTLRNLIPATVYEAQISSRCGGNLYSPVGRKIRFRTEKCEIPFNLLIDSTGYNFIGLSWPGVNAAGYEVFYKQLSDTSWSVRSSNASFVRINQLTADNYYQFKVRARCAVGAYSDFSPTITIPTLRCQKPEYAVIDTIAPGRIRIRWKSVPGLHNGYQLTYKKLGDTTVTVRNVRDTFIVLNLDTASNWNFTLATRCRNGVLSGLLSFDGPEPQVGLPCELTFIGFTTGFCGRRFTISGRFSNSGTVTVTNAGGSVVETSNFNIMANDRLPGGGFNKLIDFQDLKTGDPDLHLNDPSRYPRGTYNICVTMGSGANNPTVCSLCVSVCLPFIPPTVTITQTPEGSCPIIVWILNAQGNGCPVGNYTWRFWNTASSDWFLIGNTPSIRVTPTVSTRYQVQYVDQNGCASTAAEVTVEPVGQQQPGIFKTCGPDICFGQTYQAEFNYTGQQGETDTDIFLNKKRIYPPLYQIDERDMGGGVFDYTYRVYIPPTEYRVGRNVVRISRFNLDFSCQWIDSCVFNVFPALTGTITASAITVPSGGSVTLTAAPAGGKPPYTYSWTPVSYPTGVLSPANTASVTANNITATQEFCVEIRDALGCSARLCQVITVEQCPDACCKIEVENRNNICTRNQFRLCVTGGSGPYDRYDWDIPWNEGIITTTVPCIDIQIPSDWIGSRRQISVLAYKGLLIECRTTIGIFEIGNTIPGTKECTYATSAEMVAALSLPGPVPTLTPAIWGAGTIVFPNDFTVNSTIRFRDMNVVVRAQRVIQVVRRGRFWLDKCVVSGENGQEWTGIQTIGTGSSRNQPIVELDSTLLQHAQIGINASGDVLEPRRSLVRADSSCFNENRTHIRMFFNPARWDNPPAGVDPNITALVLRADTFTCINPLPGTTADFTDLAIAIRRVNSIQVGNPGFYFGRRDWVYSYNRINRADVGIRIQASGGNINNFNFNDLIPDTRTGVTGPIGIEVSPFTDAGNSGPAGTVYIGTQRLNIFFPGQPNTLERGIFVTGNQAYVDVISNLFLNLHNNTGLAGRAATGVWLENLNQSTVQVENNIMWVNERCIHTNRSIAGDPQTTILVDNNLIDRYQNGFHSTANTADALYTTTVSNNKISNYVPVQSGVVASGYDAGINMWGLGIGQTTDNRTEILDNDFTGTGNIGIAMVGNHLTPVHRPLIARNTILPTEGNYLFGINPSSSPGVRMIDNTVRCIPAGRPAGGLLPNQLQAIQIYNSTDNEVRCNRLGGANDGIYAILNCGLGSVGTGTHLAYNLFSNNIDGIEIQNNGIIGNQGNGSLLNIRAFDPNAGNSNYNGWKLCVNAANSTFSVGNNQTITTTNRLVGFIDDPINVGMMPSITTGGTPINFVQAPNYLQPFNYPGAGCDNPSDLDFFTFASFTAPETDNRLKDAETIVKGYETIGIHGDAIRYMSRYNLLEALSAPDNRMTEESMMLDSFFNANRTSVAAQLITVDRLIPRNRAQAKLLNDQIVPANLIEANMKTFNRIFINWLETGKYTPADLEAVIEIADQCLPAGGKAVAQARNLRTGWEKYMRAYDDNCIGSTTPENRKTVNVPNVKAEILLYPNPAQNSVEVKYHLTEEPSAITVINQLGIEVSKKAVKGKKGLEEIDTRTLSSGVYVLQLKAKDGAVISSQKLVIVK